VRAWYCTREDVMSAPDFKESARNSRQIDRAIASATAAVADMCHREFSPGLATRYFSWPNLTYARPWRLWLDEFELLQVTSITTGGVLLDQSEYFLEPVNDPPFDRVEINLGSQASFTASTTFQRSIAITGLWGYSHNQESVASLVSPVTSTSTSIDVDNSGSDRGLMRPMLERTRTRLKRLPRRYLADGGFCRGEDIEWAHGEGIEVYCPPPNSRSGVDPFLPRSSDGPGVAAWRARMASEAGKAQYQARTICECIHARWRNWDLRQLTVRGIEKVRAVVLWYALTNNILQGHRLAKA